MIYLGRPIFPFVPNWDLAVARQATYDLRELKLGFGAEFFTPTADYTVTGWDFSVTLKNTADILAWENFSDSLKGMLYGFWLPTPIEAAKFYQGISTAQFDIEFEDLASTWDARPDQHLLLTAPDGTQQAAQIQSVQDNGDGTERVTLTAALTRIPGAGSKLQRLHFVRLATDTEEMDLLAENVANLKLTVIELPQEYTAAATGLQPIYLYEIAARAPVNKTWFYTSFAAPIASNGNLFSVWPMNHTEVAHATDGQDYHVQIDAKPDETHPFALFAGIPPAKPIWVNIYSVQLAAPDLRTKIFSGFIASVTDDGQKFSAKCSTRLQWLQTKLPRYFIGSSCNHILFDPDTCKAKRALFETTVTHVKLDGGSLPKIEVTFNFAFHLDDWKKDGWFAGGMLEKGLGVTYEIRTVIYSHWNGNNLELTLGSWFKSLAVGDQMQLVAGCDHSAATCKIKFNNFENFGGFVAVPDRNLTLKGLNTNVSAGNKK